MKIVIEIDEKSLQWLRGLIQNSYDSTRVGQVKPHLFDSVPHIQAWHQALAHPEVVHEPQPVVEVPKVSKKVQKAQERKAKAEKQAAQVFTCSSHPTYHGLRSPRTDCDECWSLYATRNGVTQAKHKRAAFQRREKLKN